MGSEAGRRAQPGLKSLTGEGRPAPAVLLALMMLRSPRRPLVLILLTPILTVPATALLLPPNAWEACKVQADMFSTTATCASAGVVVALAPGLLNLLPLLWARAADPKVRTAAIAATALGAARFLIPVLAFVIVPVGGSVQFTQSAFFPGTRDSVGVWPVSVSLWIATLATFLLMRYRARVGRSRESEPVLIDGARPELQARDRDARDEELDFE